MRSQSQQTKQAACGAAAPDSIEFGPAISLRGARMRFERNEEIFGESETAGYVYRVVSGAVRTMRFSSDGRRQILGFHLPGDVFGWELGDTHTLSAEAVSAADVIMVRRSLVEKASAQDLQAAHAVLDAPPAGREPCSAKPPFAVREHGHRLTFRMRHFKRAAGDE
jgi:hypothetical protein